MAPLLHTLRAHIKLGTAHATEAQAKLTKQGFDPLGAIDPMHFAGDAALTAQWVAKFPPKAGNGLGGLGDFPPAGGGRRQTGTRAPK
jgi:hypothetical protein